MELHALTPTMDKYQLSQMNPCDGIVLQTAMEDQCDKLAVDHRMYCQLSGPKFQQQSSLSC